MSSLLNANLATMRRGHSARCRAVGVIAALASVAGCNDGVSPSATGHAYVRVVNAVYQGADASSATPIAIDYLFDSLLVAPSIANLDTNKISVGDSASGYGSIASGVHGFVARRAGDTTFNSSIYTTSTDAPYYPRQFLTGDTYYTFVVAGIIPLPGAPILDGTVRLIAIIDDQFPGPRINDVLQARFKVLNAAPFASVGGTGAGVRVYVTPDSATPPTNITAYVQQATANYRNVSTYLNVDPGTYWITITLNTSAAPVLAQQKVVFAQGEVRTLVLQSTTAGPPSQSNHKLTNLLDHLYGQ